MKQNSRLYCASTLAFFFLGVSISAGQTNRPTESQVEAAYLYNFGKFVTWPSDLARSADTFEICLIGKDPFGSILDATVSGESINGKKIAIARISRMQEGSACNIVFISSSEASHLPGIVVESRRMHVLTVSDMPHFAERGGMIGLIDQDGRIRFEVNRNEAELSHLGLSSELLKVAVKVIASKPAGSEP
ncbi:MAG TPA: YfiR family protein [Candidatus Sulfotelmatobacter sp.]|nr:YfiR family protein [Candidatus Sulfotelmatobacter sp.]